MPVAIATIISEANQRAELKKRLSQIQESLNTRQVCIDAGLQELRELIPEKGEQPSQWGQFADKQMSLHMILQENGFDCFPEEVELCGRQTTDRNLQVAAVLLAERTKEGIIGCLERICTLPFDRDPNDQAHVCQAEIFRHFRGLLYHLVRIDKLPECAEGMHLLRQLFPAPPASLCSSVDDKEDKTPAAQDEPTDCKKVNEIVISDGQIENEKDAGGEELTDREKLILETMSENEITSKRRRKRQADVVKLMNRTLKPATCKRAFANLKRMSYLCSLDGPAGGVWLLQEGIEEAGRISSAN